jgi:hypothetical protein
MSLPFVIVRAGHDDIPLFAGQDNGSLVGITAPDGEVLGFEPEDVVAAVNIEPTAIYWGLTLEMRAPERRRGAAEARARRRAVSGHYRTWRFLEADIDGWIQRQKELAIPVAGERTNQQPEAGHGR